jgi:hypothetical protein
METPDGSKEKCFENIRDLFGAESGYTGQFKNKVTLSHVYNEATSEPTITRHTIVLYPKRLLVWSRHFATRSLLAAAARNTFPRQLQTNF